MQGQSLGQHFPSCSVKGKRFDFFCNYFIQENEYELESYLVRGLYK